MLSVGTLAERGIAGCHPSDDSTFNEFVAVAAGLLVTFLMASTLLVTFPILLVTSYKNLELYSKACFCIIKTPVFYIFSTKKSGDETLTNMMYILYAF